MIWGASSNLRFFPGNQRLKFWNVYQLRGFWVMLLFLVQDDCVGLTVHSSGYVETGLSEVQSGT